MTITRRDRAAGIDLSKVLKSYRQNIFSAIAVSTFFLAIGSLFKYSDFRSGIGLFVVLILVMVAFWGFWGYAKVIAKRNSLGKQKNQIAIALSIAPIGIVIVCIIVGLLI